MMDVRTADGSVVKISAGSEQDLAKTLGAEMVQNMYKVCTEDVYIQRIDSQFRQITSIIEDIFEELLQSRFIPIFLR